MNKPLITLLAVFSTVVGLYPLSYFVVNGKFGLLQSKTEALLSNSLWNTGFYSHITFGGIALLLGWTQFNKKWRNRFLHVHRAIGKTYVVTALISATAGIYIAFYSNGGIIAAAGFICLGIVWFMTTLRAFNQIRLGKIDGHKIMMIFSYASCLAAVTLRIYLPVLIRLLHDFNLAYSIVAWLCWIPNLIIAFFIVNKRKTTTRLTDLQNQHYDQLMHQSK